jgi:deoxyhypusine monooxygenase
VLLKHEVAYVLGQMKMVEAIPPLSAVLEDTNQDAMTRHEAAEALGAIGDDSSLPLLKKLLEEGSTPLVVRETCEIAIDLLEWERKKVETHGLPASSYASVDPAPCLPIEESKNVSELRSMLLNTDLPLFQRYRAMFSLRNIGNEDAVLALADGLNDTSDLFRHEIGTLHFPLFLTR